MNTLSDVFPNDFRYLCAKLPEYAEAENEMNFQGGAQRASQVYKALLALKSRVPKSQQGLALPLNRVIYAVEKLIGFYRDKDSSGLTIDDAYIFGSFIETEALKIHRMATEYDKQHEE